MRKVERNFWRHKANCEGADPAIFFADRGANTRAPALAYCNECQVRDCCLAEAVVIPDLLGIWGGKTYRESRKIRNSLKLDSKMAFEDVLTTLKSQRSTGGLD